MVDLTVGYVAGVIALGIVFAQLVCLNVLTYILAGVVQDSETAGTWTVAAKTMLSSHWPMLLRADSSQSTGVRRIVSNIAISVPLISVIISIAGVITPLGLYNALETMPEKTVAFSYASDSGTFALGTVTRGIYDFSRLCSMGHGLLGQGPAPCPYSNNTVIFTNNGTTMTWDMPNGYSTKVPAIVREIYSSGTKAPTTISNFFDIEWRQISTMVQKNVEEGKPYAVSMFRQVDSVVLDDALKAVEGLVVDAKSGGIGFRNHTIPILDVAGASWTEELLFIEPETACVNTNLTLDFTVSAFDDDNATNGLRDFSLTDRGGFAHLDGLHYPEYAHDDAQNNPDLVARAYKAAWLNNAYTMMYFNVTNPNNETTGAKAFSYLNSTVGQKFPLLPTGSDPYNALGLSTTFGGYLWGTQVGNGPLRPKWPNPFGVGPSMFTDVSISCEGAANGDIANITNIYVACGLMRGVPVRVDGGASAIFEAESQWSSQLHACASAVRATVKRVKFSYNSTFPGLSGLSVEAIEELDYTTPGAVVPLWGVEDSGLYLDGISPVWGLIAEPYTKFPNISTTRKPSFYIPGLSTSYGLGVSASTAGSSIENLAGADFPPQVMNAVYLDVGSMPFDMRGVGSMSMFLRWQNLSQKAETAGSIIDLIWTDLAASAVVGTKGTLGSYNAGLANETTAIKVTPVMQGVGYQYLFGIPAFIVLLLFISIVLWALFSMITRRSSLSRLRQRIKQVSVGRVITTFLDSGASTMTMPSRQWSRINGAKVIDYGPQVMAAQQPMGLNQEPTPTTVTYHSGYHHPEQFGILPDDGKTSGQEYGIQSVHLMHSEDKTINLDP